jgi:hypothetical protein
MKYLTGYPEEVRAQVRQLVQQGRLGDILLKKYPAAHDIRTDKALYDYIFNLKNRFLRNAAPINKAAFDNRVQVIQHVLGLRGEGREIERA